ncbi:hypothetical protein BGZ98_008566 [Dissophora globulifera]|nr:hypothetical protein BGZ98_008566 [Dissophora globulifera]
MPPRFVPTASPRCSRCSKAVYSAEQVIGPNGGAWHKSCFTCKECNRRLDSNTLAEHEGEAYCKACHKKMWGPTGYGYASNLLMREDPESQFKQSIGRPVNTNNTGGDNVSTTYSTLDEAVVRNTTGGSSVGGRQSDFGSASPRRSQEETEEERRERLTPVNATLKKRNSLDMIREQAEASRRAYDEAHAQRVANKYGRVNANSTGNSTTSTGSRGEIDSQFLTSSGSGPNPNSGYLSAGSDTSSAFGSTMATTSSPAPSFSSISSVSSSQPATKSLYLNQSLRSNSNMSPSQQPVSVEQHDAESDYAKSRQALSFQTGVSSVSSASSGSYNASTPVTTTHFTKKDSEPARVEPNVPAGNINQDNDDLDYAPFRLVARKEETSAAAPPAIPEWGTEPTTQKKPAETAQSLPMYRSQYLQQQRHQEQLERESKPVAPSPSSESSGRLNQLINETDKLNLREQEARQQQQQQGRVVPATPVEVDEWDEEPTPNVPSRPQNLSYTPARNVSSAATRTWTPTVNTSSDTHTSGNSSHTRAASGDFNNDKTSSPVRTVPLSSSGSISSVPNTSYYRSGGIMTPKKATSSFGGGGDICPRCQKTVYHAESALAPGGAKYHKLCLRCVECSKSLDSTNMTDRQGAPYCKTCYGKAFGAKGYGYGSGSSMLHTEL